MNRAHYAVLIPTQGPARPRSIDTASKDILAELQGLVGGYIETYRTRAGKWILLCNEEGKLQSLPVNETATYLFMQNPCDYFAGDVLLVEDGGEDFAYFTYSDALDLAETINAACKL